MNTAASEYPLNSQATAPAAVSATRPMYCSVQRELWEHRSIYIAPLIVAGVAMLGFFISLISLPKTLRELPQMDPAHQRLELAMPFAHSGMLLILSGFLVGAIYCLDALHGERRDRSILFWKSLPVSDRTTVLAKASIPLVVLPVITLVVTMALQWVMLSVSSVTLLFSGIGVTTLWARLPLFQMQVGLLYIVTVLALSHAPIYAWLLLVSGWARRATFLWAVLPPAAIAIFEAVAFRTSHIGVLLRDRLLGFAAEAFNLKGPDGAPIDAHFIPLNQFTPGRFLSTPGLWIGLIAAAGFLAAAVRLRRYREPA